MSQAAKKHELDVLVETIEFTLISVIQGVALYFFINDSKDILIGLHYEYWIYIAVAFTLLCMFWSQALVHIMGFISWPLEFVHTFLYFLVVGFEVLLFESLTKPAQWFFWNMFFFGAVGLLYYADLRLLRTKKSRFEKIDTGIQFYKQLQRQQKIGLYILTPAGICFSFVAWKLITTYPDVFLTQHWHLLLGLLQLLVAVTILIISLITFKAHFKCIEVITKKQPS